jgi:hypothetical protein
VALLLVQRPEDRVFQKASFEFFKRLHRQPPRAHFGKWSPATLRGTGFVEIEKESLPLPQYKLTIEVKDNSQIEVYGYQIDDKVIINSTQNPDAYFDGSEGNLFNRVFIGSKKFVNK